MSDSRKFTKEEKDTIRGIVFRCERTDLISHTAYERYEKAKLICGFIIFVCVSSLMVFYWDGYRELVEMFGTFGVLVIHVAPLVCAGILFSRNRAYTKASVEDWETRQLLRRFGLSYYPADRGENAQLLDRASLEDPDTKQCYDIKTIKKI